MSYVNLSCLFFRFKKKIKKLSFEFGLDSTSAMVKSLGDGLKDAMSDAAAGSAVRDDAEGSIYGFQTRLLIFIDDFFKAPAAK